MTSIHVNSANFNERRHIYATVRQLEPRVFSDESWDDIWKTLSNLAQRIVPFQSMPRLSFPRTRSKPCRCGHVKTIHYAFHPTSRDTGV
jgi:hypothetical protein